MAESLASLFQFALELPDATEGIACAGTRLEARTAQVRGKAFLFFGAATLRCKLADSLAEARACATADPARYEVGASGWIRIAIEDEGALPAARMRRWITESYTLTAGGGTRKKAAAPKTLCRAKKAGPMRR